ncbi:MAG: DUF5667 domain-containing protein [Anaerolineae bacterium]
MNKSSDAILLQCLERLEDGQSIESILARFSRYESELRPILESTRRLQGLSVEPPPVVQQRAKAAFLAQAATQAGGSTACRTWPALRPSLLVSAMALLLLVLFIGATVVPASASAIPGDMLYGTKRAVEQWRLVVAAGPEEEATLLSSFQKERLREVAKLLATGRNADVSFDGTLQSSAGQQWVVSGLPVLVDSGTVIVGSPKIGMEVRVTGFTGEGELLASEIRVLGGGIGLDDDDIYGDDLDDDDLDDDDLDDDGLDDDGPDDDGLDDDGPDDDGLDDDGLDDDGLDDDDLDDDDVDDDDVDDDDFDDGLDDDAGGGDGDDSGGDDDDDGDGDDDDDSDDDDDD